MAHYISALRPAWAVPGARVAIEGLALPVPPDGPPRVLVGEQGERSAHVAAASHTSLRFVVPDDAEGGKVAVRIDDVPGETVYLDIARPITTGVHQVDNPAFGADGSLYCTVSGNRGAKPPVPLYRIGRDGAREPLAVDIGNPTSLARGPDGLLYISSRFDGQVYRLVEDSRAEVFATELGVATGLAFAADGHLFVGDRSGTILRVSPDRHVDTIATIPASIAAFHLATGPDDCLYVSAPTLSTHDPIYRISSDRQVSEVYQGFGRPQGLAFDSSGLLYVVEALAGQAGVYRLDLSQAKPEAELVLSAPALVGIAFAPDGGLVVASSDTVWKLECPLRPL